MVAIIHFTEHSSKEIIDHGNLLVCECKSSDKMIWIIKNDLVTEQYIQERCFEVHHIIDVK
jgi:hypothetical protein